MKKRLLLRQKQVLLSAIFIEDRNAKRYSEWSDRFRPYHDEACHLLEELEQEELEHKKQLETVYAKKFQELPNLKSLKIDQALFLTEELKMPDEHFFVINKEMAVSILQATLVAEEDAYKFYQSILRETEDEDLLAVCKLLSEFEEDHVLKVVNWIDKYKNELLIEKNAH